MRKLTYQVFINIRELREKAELSKRVVASRLVPGKSLNTWQPMKKAQDQHFTLIRYLCFLWQKPLGVELQI